MRQDVPHYCPQCGINVGSKQKFCTRCSFPLQDRFQVMLSSPRSGHVPTVTSATMVAASPRHGTSRTPHMFTAASRRRRLGRVSLLLLGLAIGLLLGAVGFFSIQTLDMRKPVQAAIKTTPIGVTVNYAGANLTIQDVQQARNFLDDPHSRSNGMLRLHIQAHNTTGSVFTLSYASTIQLRLPQGTAITPLFTSPPFTYAPDATASAMLDFAFPQSQQLSSVIVRLGRANEAQYDIPLRTHADVSRYAPVQSTPQAVLQYFGLDWTLQRVVTSYSIAAQQAPQGMRFITITLRVDSMLSQQAIVGSPFDYIHLTEQGQSLVPVQTTLPVSFAGGEQGKIGTVVFVIPQNISTCTLVLATPDNEGFALVSTNIQLSINL